MSRLAGPSRRPSISAPPSFASTATTGQLTPLLGGVGRSAVSRRVAPMVAMMTALLAAVAMLLACGGPRERELNPGPPAYPPPLFTEELPGPEYLGTTWQRLEVLRQTLAVADADRPDQREMVEFFANHPYVISVHYLIDDLDQRVVQMRYELHPEVIADLSLRMALLGELVAAYGMPEEMPDGFRWEYAHWRFRWIGVSVVVTRSGGATGGS